jgi:peroxiredoxin
MSGGLCGGEAPEYSIVLGRLVVCAALMGLVAGCSHRPDTLAIGSAAPEFSLPGTDGKVHALADYADSPVLVIVFTCTHCPVSELYEERLEQLSRDYGHRGVQVVAINPAGPRTTTLQDLAYSDVPETLDGMRARAGYRHLDFAYLYDGDTQRAATAFKAVATPQAYVFDAKRTLQYVGRIDDNVRADEVKASETRAAIDALLAGRPVDVATTDLDGCPIEWIGQKNDVENEQTVIKSSPIDLQLVGKPELASLRQNGTPNLMLMNFWATWCPPCVSEFPEMQSVYRSYRSRHLELVTVSEDIPAAKPGVLKMLQEQHASSTNRMFNSDDTAGLQDAFDTRLPASVPFTLLVATNGDVVYQQLGEADFPSLRRAILANLPADPRYPGLQAYWAP